MRKLTTSAALLVAGLLLAAAPALAGDEALDRRGDAWSAAWIAGAIASTAVSIASPRRTGRPREGRGRTGVDQCI